MAYMLLKWLHLLAVIVAFGANLTYPIWLLRAARSPEALPFTLRVIKLIDDRVVNPAYGVLLLTGLPMAFTAHIPLSTPWLLVALTLYVLVMLIALVVYTLTLGRQIHHLESEGWQSPGYQAMDRRGKILGVILTLLVIAILVLMVAKPVLWK